MPPGNSFQAMRARIRAVLLALPIVFLVGVTARTYGATAESAWSFWLGEILLRAELVAMGAIGVAWSLLDSAFPSEMRPVSGSRIRHISGERIKWVVIGIATATVGVFLVVNGLHLMLSGCEPPGLATLGLFCAR